MRAGVLFDILFGVVLIMSLIVIVVGMSAVIVDTITLKNIGEESVPCLDKNNRPFENEMCTKTITCSWLGFMADRRCVNVEMDE